MKANPHTALLAHLIGRVPHLDVSSGGEVERALTAGWNAADLSFTGPGKREWEIDLAIRSGVGYLIAESVRELEVADRLARTAGTSQNVLIRIGPETVPRGFGGSMSGRPSQFGIDEEALPDVVDTVESLDALNLMGFHIYAGTQCLSADTLVENFRLMSNSFRRAAALFDVEPEVLVFGSGFGIPYYPDSEPLDLRPLAREIREGLDDLRSLFGASRFLLETGRYVVGEAGVYATRVVDVKESRGHSVVICDGGMNHHLGAAGHLGTVLPRNYRMFRATSGDAVAGRTRGSTHDVVGPLCTTIDTLGRAVELGPLGVGDVIGIECSGAYGPSVSPGAFISHPAPVEVFVRDGEDGPIFEVPADARPTFTTRTEPEA